MAELNYAGDVVLSEYKIQINLLNINPLVEKNLVSRFSKTGCR
jgi:hypothetical protein